MNYEYFNTMLMQSLGNKIGSTAPQITPSASFGYEDAMQAQDIFWGTKKLFLYAKVKNPTNVKLESIVTKTENSFGAIIISSNTGDISMVLSAILSANDEILCISGFFGGILKRFAIKNSFCEIDDFFASEYKIK